MGNVELRANNKGDLKMDFDKIVERKLSLAEEGADLPIQLSIEIGRPRWVEIDTEAACPVIVRGLMDAEINIYGSDLLNALECALSFVKAELSNLPSTKKVIWPDGESYLD